MVTILFEVGDPIVRLPLLFECHVSRIAQAYNAVTEVCVVDLRRSDGMGFKLRKIWELASVRSGATELQRSPRSKGLQVIEVCLK